MKILLQLLQEKPYLTWYIADKAHLSQESIMEHIYNYGTWEDYLVAEKTFGIHKARALFDRLKKKNRVNLKAKTIHYFEKYYQRHA